MNLYFINTCTYSINTCTILLQHVHYTSNSRYERRGWVTYSAETNIKDVSARISATKVRLIL